MERIGLIRSLLAPKKGGKPLGRTHRLQFNQRHILLVGCLGGAVVPSKDDLRKAQNKGEDAAY
jgi:hypothetical protein